MKHLKFLMGSVLTVLAMTQFAHADTFTDRKKILSDIRTTNYKARLFRWVGTPEHTTKTPCSSGETSTGHSPIIYPKRWAGWFRSFLKTIGKRC